MQPTITYRQCDDPPIRDDYDIPRELDAFMLSYPTDACPHFKTYTREVGGMIYGMVPATDDIRLVEVCMDCGAWLEDEYA